MNWSGLLTLLAIGYALFISACALLIAQRLRRPPRRTYAWALRKGIPGDPGERAPPLEFAEREIVWTAPRSRRAVTIPVWDVRGGVSSGGGPVVVLTPGWGDSRVGGLVRLSALAPHCSRILLWDPPGLGESAFAGGTMRAQNKAPRWSMSVDDHLVLLAALDAMIAPDDASPIVLFGWSAGAGASILAAEASLARTPPHTIAGVIAEAPYRLPWTPARNVLRAAQMPWFLCGPLAFASLGLRLGVGPVWRGFDRAAHAASLKGRIPLLVLHGDADEVCPIDDGRAIASAADAQLVEVPGGRHNDLWIDERLACQSAAAVVQFLARCAGSTSARPWESPAS